MVMGKISKRFQIFTGGLLLATIALLAIKKANNSNAVAIDTKDDVSVLAEEYYTSEGDLKKYTEYIADYKNNTSLLNEEEIHIPITSYKEGEDVSAIKNYEGKMAVLTNEQGYITWEATVEKEGLYAIGITYYPIKGYGSDIERNVTIDGKNVFKETESIEFTRIYADEEECPSGKVTRPNQVEAPRWISAYITDSLGYYGDALYFYLSAGSHTITFTSVKEPMAISELCLISKDLSPNPYEQVIEKQKAEGAVMADGVLEDGVIVIQAENTYEKGDPTLYAVSDSTSTKTEPFDYKNKLLNAIGGTPWKYSNQWMSWKVSIPADGFYHMGARSKQNYVRDIYCNRTLYVDGEVPFLEAENIHFDFSDDWKVTKFGEEEPYLFYLTKGEHTISLKVTAGDLEGILTKADYILEDLNSINLELLALLSINPDTNRDYQIGRYMPETVLSIEKNAKRLQQIYDELVAKTGTTDSLTSQLEQLISLLTKMHEKPDQIASLYSRYRELIGTFGNWIMTVREHPVLLDYLFVAEADTKLDTKDDGFLKKLYSGFASFLYSFGSDDTMLSEENDEIREEDTITVWIGSGLTGGRDQAMALNEMISSEFTKETGIGVNLQLVPESTILMATLAGRGPDVALQVKTTDPVDYALRNAVYDLSQFEDYEEVSTRFFSSAKEPFVYNEGVYALPETMSFPMLFYRTDILEELGIDVSKLTTWDSIVEILPVLQAENMNFALPATMQTYSMFLYQMGGEYYTKDCTASDLSSKTALDAFEYWTDFYSVYSLTVDFSFENRFRTGEMPIGIAEYTTYNLLSISAPEIKGKWAMIQLPGMRASDGTIVNTAPTTSQGCMLMNASTKKDKAWEFMKWWTKADSQYEFGKQLEAVMGAAARYNTANKEALQMMPWSAIDRIGLMTQAENIHGIPQVPGGYYTERNLNFAKLAVINDAANPRESLTNYAENITDEITMKRKEFGLSLHQE
ncbi:MAG: extracellular solute-binding protein [Lachnospiraceae bacterium]|nr:extracellular solute-binding protein [Lachnospiraceae bacterium]